MADRVNGGMSFEEILETGDDDSLYQSLVSTLINDIDLDTTEGADSTFNDLVEQLLNGDEDQQTRASRALSALLDEWEGELNLLIEKDLDSQDQVRQQLENLNIAAEIDPAATNIQDSPLYDLIATDEFREIFETGVDAR